MARPRIALSRRNAPTGLRLSHQAVAYLLLEHFHVSGWQAGVAYTLMVIYLLACIADLFTCEERKL